MREPEHLPGPSLVLWDVDHTLIDNGGTSKAGYALAFQLLTGERPRHPARTDGRTDAAVMAELLADHGLPAARFSSARRQDALAAAGIDLRTELLRNGRALPGAAEALRALARQPHVTQSVLTGNIEANARLKLAAFGLDGWLDLEIGAYGDIETDRAELVPQARRRAEARGAEGPIVLVGDTPRDVAAGRVGGAGVVAVATGRYTEAELAAAGADAVLPDLRDTRTLLSALCRVLPPPR